MEQILTDWEASHVFLKSVKISCFRVIPACRRQECSIPWDRGPLATPRLFRTLRLVFFRIRIIMTRFRQSIREALVISLIGTALGFLYTGLTEKGLFASHTPKQSQTEPVMEYPPEFISYEEALAFYTSGEALFVDSRYEYDFQLGHIKGSVNLPLKEYDEKLDVLRNIPKDRTLVTYCDGEECNSSIELAKKLTGMGFTKVKIFFGGWREWQSHDLPTEGSPS